MVIGMLLVSLLYQLNQSPTLKVKQRDDTIEQVNRSVPLYVLRWYLVTDYDWVGMSLPMPVSRSWSFTQHCPEYSSTQLKTTRFSKCYRR